MDIPVQKAREWEAHRSTNGPTSWYAPFPPDNFITCPHREYAAIFSCQGLDDTQKAQGWSNFLFLL